MKLLGLLSGLFSKSEKGVIRDVFEGIDGLVTSREEKEQLKIKALDMYIEDRKSARQMYMNDSWLQKTFALIFMAAYLVLTGILLYGLYTYLKSGSLEVDQWVVALVSSIWGGLSSKLNTIVDFLFGSSKGSQDKDYLSKDLKPNKQQNNG